MELSVELIRRLLPNNLQRYNGFESDYESDVAELPDFDGTQQDQACSPHQQQQQQEVLAAVSSGGGLINDDDDPTKGTLD